MYSKFKALHDSFSHHASIICKLKCFPTQMKAVTSYSSFKASLRKLAKSIKFQLVKTLRQQTITLMTKSMILKKMTPRIAF